MQRRFLVGVVAGTLLMLAIIGLLAFVHTNAILADGKHCFATGIVHAQWPKWIGCLMGTHETLAAGLIGASGALLAALIAADAVWQQVRDARQQFQAAEVRRTEIERYNLRRALEYYSRILQPFDQAPGAEGIKYVHGLNTLYKTGNLVPFFGSLSPEYQPVVRDAWERLSNLNYALGELQKSVGMSGTVDIKSRAEINESIRVVIRNMREHREVVDRELSIHEGAEQSPLRWSSSGAPSAVDAL